MADPNHAGALEARSAEYKRSLASPVMEAAAAAELTAASRPGRTVEGMYCEITALAADVNCAPSVIWRLAGERAKVLELRRARVRIEEYMVRCCEVIMIPQKLDGMRSLRLIDW